MVEDTLEFISAMFIYLQIRFQTSPDLNTFIYFQEPYCNKSSFFDVPWVTRSLLQNCMQKRFNTIIMEGEMFNKFLLNSIKCFKFLSGYNLVSLN